MTRSKTVMITGASSGFGKACATLFARKKWQLIITGRRQERLNELRDELREHADVYALRFDIRDRSELTRQLEALPANFKNIEVLVNNAGLSRGLEPAYEANLDDWEEMVDTNIKGLLYCTREVLPGMVERGRGHVVNIGSVAGSTPYPGGNVYGATKAFVGQFSRNLKADLLGTQVRVTNIEPGIAETEFSLVRFHGDREKAARVYEHTESLTAEDIAEIVYWVVSRPSHVNINNLEVMPTCQAWGPFVFDREGKG